MDDHSRFIFYAKFVENESSWAHIQAIQSTVLKYGCPYSYYTDCHSIFRYIRHRDQLHYNVTKFTDDANPQWRQVLKDCGIKPIPALSPQAKGKIERSFGWLQDRVIRCCVRNDVKDIKHGQRILDRELQHYNFKWIHSTTEEIPHRRLQNALNQNKSLFTPFKIPKPFLLPKDIFCLRATRLVDNYRTVILGNMKFKLNCHDTRISVDIRIYPLTASLIELRFWHKDQLIDVRKVKKSDLRLSTFHL